MGSKSLFSSSERISQPDMIYGQLPASHHITLTMFQRHSKKAAGATATCAENVRHAAISRFIYMNG